MTMKAATHINALLEINGRRNNTRFSKCVNEAKKRLCHNFSVFLTLSASLKNNNFVAVPNYNIENLVQKLKFDKNLLLRQICYEMNYLRRATK